MSAVQAILLYFPIVMIFAISTYSLSMDTRGPVLPKVRCDQLRARHGSREAQCTGHHAVPINLPAGLARGTSQCLAWTLPAVLGEICYSEDFHHASNLLSRCHSFTADNLHYLPTRDTCLYHMNATERKDLEYEDGMPIYDVVYQCQRYVQYCCGLTCCLDESSKSLDTPSIYQEVNDPWWYTSSAFRTKMHFPPFLTFFALLFQCSMH